MFHYSTTPSDFEELCLIPDLNHSYIPKDLFIKHRFRIITLWGNDQIAERPRPEIHPEAFGSSSRNYTKIFRIHYCDISYLNFIFLVGFHQLNILHIQTSTQVHLHNMPSLPNLFYLSFMNVYWGNTWTNKPKFINGLHYLELVENALNDKDAEQILTFIQSGPSKDTLIGLNISWNSLTQIPKQIKCFRRLQTLNICCQKTPGFGLLSGLNLPGALNLLVSSSFITDIQPETFQGKYTDIFWRMSLFHFILGFIGNEAIDVSFNKLTRFPSSVFKEFLEKIAIFKGTIYAGESK